MERERTRSERVAEFSLALLGCMLSIAPLLLNMTRQPNSPVSPADWARWPMPALVFFEAAAAGLVGLAAATGGPGTGVLMSLLRWVVAGVLLVMGVPTIFSIGLLLLPAGLALGASAWFGARRTGSGLGAGIVTALLAGIANAAVILYLARLSR